MLVTLNETLEWAERNKCAVGSFNTTNLESIRAVIEAAEELNVPVVIMHAEVHESITPINVIGPVMVELAKRAKVPVCVHLDHGETLEYLSKALDLGFTSIMYDGSTLDYETNVENTIKAVTLAKSKGASVEAEIGVLGKRELGAGHDDDEKEHEMIYTDPDFAQSFVKDTGIDALACSFGTAHGLYLTKPKLNMNVLDKINSKVDVPIVMHGGSGVSVEDYIEVISKGVRKINYYTYMAKEGGEEVARKINEHSGNVIYYHDICNWALSAMKENAKQAMKVFAGMN